MPIGGSWWAEPVDAREQRRPRPMSEAKRHAARAARHRKRKAAR